MFGFAELIQALALFVVAYTITDARFKLRLATAPIRLHYATYLIITFVSLATLITDLWISEAWWMLRNPWLGVGVWQAVLGVLFVGTFLSWLFVGYIRPTPFSRRTAERFFDVVKWHVMFGNEAEIGAVARELKWSAREIVSLCPTLRDFNNDRQKSAEENELRPQDFAWDLLFLMATPRLCKQIVASAPDTVFAFLYEIREQNKREIPIGPFLSAITAEAISNKDSLLHREADQFPYDLIGMSKPWSEAMYGDFDSLLASAKSGRSAIDLDYRVREPWDAGQWRAYSHSVLVAIESFLVSRKSNSGAHIIRSAVDDIKSGCVTFKIGGDVAQLQDEARAKLRVAVDFVQKFVELIEKHRNQNVRLASMKLRNEIQDRDLYDCAAEAVFDICVAVSTVHGDQDNCWWIHYGETWSHLFRDYDVNYSWRVVQFKARRLLWDEVRTLASAPNYRNVRLAGYLLNILGVQVGQRRHNGRPLARLLIPLIRSSYLKLRMDFPDVANSMLFGSVSYDEKGRRLVRTYSRGLSKEGPRVYLDLISE